MDSLVGRPTFKTNPRVDSSNYKGCMMHRLCDYRYQIHPSVTDLFSGNIGPFFFLLLWRIHPHHCMLRVLLLSALELNFVYFWKAASFCSILRLSGSQEHISKSAQDITYTSDLTQSSVASFVKSQLKVQFSAINHMVTNLWTNNLHGGYENPFHLMKLGSVTNWYDILCLSFHSLIL